MKKYIIVDNKDIQDKFNIGDEVKIYTTEESLVIMSCLKFNNAEHIIKQVGEMENVIGFTIIEKGNSFNEFVHLYDYEAREIVHPTSKYELFVYIDKNGLVSKRIIECIDYKDARDKAQDFEYDTSVKMITIKKVELIETLKNIMN